MIQTIIKYIAIFISIWYINCKVLFVTKNKTNTIFSIIFLVALAILIGFIKQYISIFILVACLPAIAIYFKLTYKTKIDITLISTIISFGISYAINTFTIVLTAPIIYPLINFTSGTIYFNIFDTISYILLETVQLLCVWKFFKIKRFKNTIPKLINKDNNIVSVFISAVILLLATLFLSIDDENNINLIFFVPVFSSLVCGIIFYLYWRKLIKKSYIEQIRERDLATAEKELLEKELEIKKLMESNYELASIIHKDNKLIPATQLLIYEFLSENNSSGSEDILERLDILYNERSEILHKQSIQNTNIAKTKITLLDSTIKYMLGRAIEENIIFNVTVNGDVSNIIREIGEDDLNTIIADMIENAIIATAQSKNKSILINISLLEHFYIEVFDSGIPFEISTLQNAGEIQTTTHKDIGGNGIGLMTLFKLKEKYNASIFIEEFDTRDDFTKKVSIHFDGLSQYRIKSYRQELINSERVLFID